MRLILLLAFADLVLVVYALVDCLSTDSYEIHGMPKTLWVLIIALFSPVGPIVWLISGRPRYELTGAALWHPAGSALRRAPRDLAPDDNPEFLRDVAARAREAVRARDAARTRDDEKRRRDKEPRPEATGDGTGPDRPTE